MQVRWVIGLVVAMLLLAFDVGQQFARVPDPCAVSWTEHEDGKKLTFCQLTEQAQVREEKKWENSPETWDIPWEQSPFPEPVAPRKETHQ